jgi:hypothetical protein
MADDATFTVIDPLSGKSPPPGFSAGYAKAVPWVHQGQGDRGRSTTLQYSSILIGPENVKIFTVFPFSCLAPELQAGKFWLFLCTRNI